MTEIPKWILCDAIAVAMGCILSFFCIWRAWGNGTEHYCKKCNRRTMIKIERSDANNIEPLFKFSINNNTRKYMDIIRDTEINRMIRDSL